jgi:hypothetical protein
MDHPRDQAGQWPYYARSFWLYLQGHWGIINGSLVGVLYAYSGHLTMALVSCVTSVAKKKTGHHAHGNGHGHVRVYARLRHIKRAMHARLSCWLA